MPLRQVRLSRLLGRPDSAGSEFFMNPTELVVDNGPVSVGPDNIEDMFDTVSAVADPAPEVGRAPLTSADLDALVTQLGGVEAEVTDAERVTQLDRLERVKAAWAAAQASITAAFVDSQQQVADAWHAQAAECSDRGDFDGWRAARDAEFHPDHPDTAGQDASPGAARRRARGRHSRTGTAAQIGLARRESPARGARLVSTALALTNRLPHTLAALRAGLLNEHRAELVATHTRHLNPTLQTLVDPPCRPWSTTTSSAPPAPSSPPGAPASSNAASAPAPTGSTPPPPPPAPATPKPNAASPCDPSRTPWPPSPLCYPSRKPSPYTPP
jgi:hypothetical protein